MFVVGGSVYGILCRGEYGRLIYNIVCGGLCCGWGHSLCGCQKHHPPVPMSHPSWGTHAIGRRHMCLDLVVPLQFNLYLFRLYG